MLEFAELVKFTTLIIFFIFTLFLGSIGLFMQIQKILDREYTHLLFILSPLSLAGSISIVTITSIWYFLNININIGLLVFLEILSYILLGLTILFAILFIDFDPHTKNSNKKDTFKEIEEEKC